MKRILTIAMLCLLPVAAATAQLVYVKCCVKREAVYSFGPVMLGPGNLINPGHSWYDHQQHGSCILGFAPSLKSIDLQAAMCISYILPDQSDAHCTWWREDSINIVDLCRGYGGSFLNSNFVIYDYDGDGDLDLRDYAYFQNNFEREMQ